MQVLKGGQMPSEMIVLGSYEDLRVSGNVSLYEPTPFEGDVYWITLSTPPEGDPFQRLRVR